MMRALLLSVVLFTLNLADASVEVLSPLPRELFARFPVPVLVRTKYFHDGMQLVVEVDGLREKLIPVQAGLYGHSLFEGYLYDLREGPHAIGLFVELPGGNILNGETYGFNISVRTDTDSNDLIRYIPPQNSARPRVIHWLVSKNVDDEFEYSDSDAEWWDPGIGAKPVALSMLDQYISHHKEVMSNLDQKTDAQFLIARHFPTSGLGNLFQSIISAALTAILTNRILIFDAYLVEEFFEFPRFLSTNYSYLVDHFGLSHIAQSAQHISYKGEDWLLCEPLADHLTQQFVFIESDMYFAAFLLNNEHHAGDIRRLFGSRLFSALSRFLFRPRRDIQRDVDSFTSEHFAGRQSIGIHVRTHTLGHPGYIEPYAMRDSQGHFLNSYWKCAYFAGAGGRTLTGIGGPGGRFDQAGPAELTAAAAAAGDAGGGGDGETIWGEGGDEGEDISEHVVPAVFVATDNAAVKEEAGRVLGPQVVTWEGPISRGDVDGYRAALVELLVLSLCDVIITTQV